MKPLFYALGPLIFDSFGVIVFAVLLAFQVDLVAATIAGTLAACAVVGWEMGRGRPVAALQWLSLIMVLFSAGATMLTGDPRFVMIKPSVIYVVIGTAMLRRGWMNRYIAPDEIPLVGDVMERFGFVWAGLMFATAIANLIVAMAFTPWWPAFIGAFPLASKLVLFAIHFSIVQWIGRSRRRRLQAPEAAILSAE